MLIFYLNSLLFFPVSIQVYTGLENCTRPLVFTSGSSVRASGNCHLLARQDE